MRRVFLLVLLLISAALHVPLMLLIEGYISLLVRGGQEP